ncbi:MAG: hypothetical protein U0235_18845 [Polyangiaceae bacterium]
MPIRLAFLLQVVALLVFWPESTRADGAPTPSAPMLASAEPKLRSLVKGVVDELAQACPVKSPDDRDAFSACETGLFGPSKVRAALGRIVLWGRAPSGDLKANRRDYRATQLAPDVVVGAYLPMWMVAGDFTLELDPINQTWRALVPASFRNALPEGSYPYPFWHDPKKWSDYEDANTLVLWLNASTTKIDQVTFAKRDGARPLVARDKRHMPTFDGKWMWIDARGVTQPAPTLFVGLFKPENPHLKRLDERYRAFALTMQDADCSGCHVPSNPDHMRRLVLLQTPLHAAAEVDRVIRAVKKDRMPLDDTGIEKPLPPETKTQLLAAAEAFAESVRAAKAWEAKQRPVK